jgi:FtsZ-binding cell division protein ZapB
MAYLQELERKVLQLIEKNKELQTIVSTLKKENETLSEKNQQMEASLLRESNMVEVLEDEKDTMKNSIEAILSTLNSIENAS